MGVIIEPGCSWAIEPHMALGCSQHALRWQCRPPRLVYPWQQHGPWTSSWPQVVAQTSGFCMVLGDNKGHGTWTLAVVRSQTQTWRLAAAQTRKSRGTRWQSRLPYYPVPHCCCIFDLQHGFSPQCRNLKTSSLPLLHRTPVHLRVPPRAPKDLLAPCLPRPWMGLYFLSFWIFNFSSLSLLVYFRLVFQLYLNRFFFFSRLLGPSE